MKEWKWDVSRFSERLLADAAAVFLRFLARGSLRAGGLLSAS